MKFNENGFSQGPLTVKNSSIRPKNLYYLIK